VLNRIVPAGSSRPMRANLLVVLAFGVAAVLLLTRAVVATVGIHDDLVHATPAFDGAPKDTLAVPQLDRTATLASGLAAAASPMASRFGAIAVTTGQIAASTREIRKHADAVNTSFAGIVSSTTAIRGSSTDLAAVIADLRALSGDIRTAMASSADSVGSTATSIVTLSAQAEAAAEAVRGISANIGEVRGTLPIIARHTENIAAARALRDSENARQQQPTATSR
jgi:methyl-accepting chemotaxis protein